MVNDVSASLADVAAAGGVAFVAMHMLGDPRTMQEQPVYDDVVVDVRDFLVARADAARDAGVTDVWIDPGIGFGKTLDHNLDLLANLDVLVATGYPVLVGTSRKSMLGALAARADGDGRGRPAPDRPARRLDRHRRLGAATGRGHGAGPRRGGDRAGARAAIEATAAAAA